MDNRRAGSVVHKNGRLHSIIQGGITMNEWEAHNPFSEDSQFRDGELRSMWSDQYRGLFNRIQRLRKSAVERRDEQ